MPSSALRPTLSAETALPETSAPEATTPETVLSGDAAFLAALGRRARALRVRRGMTRKGLAALSGVSERHLANLERGQGNVSILVLRDIAAALDAPLIALLGDVTTSSPEWLLIRRLLEGRDEATLGRIRRLIAETLGVRGSDPDRRFRIALIGLRGAGKTTLGRRLAEALGYPFVEISREIEKFAGCSIGEIQALYGVNAYRRYERRALEETIQLYPEAVIATPGGIVTESDTFALLLDHCITIWLQARPEDHMRRVLAQGDTRPMAASAEAMADLKTILAERTPFYAKADHTLDTSEAPLEATFGKLLALARTLIAGEAPSPHPADMQKSA
jgi:XRE family aerobic/anaerobic benzoate catabolism transcriptional regulator